MPVTLCPAAATRSVSPLLPGRRRPAIPHMSVYDSGTLDREQRRGVLACDPVQVDVGDAEAVVAERCRDRRAQRSFVLPQEIGFIADAVGSFGSHRAPTGARVGARDPDGVPGCTGGLPT